MNKTTQDCSIDSDTVSFVNKLLTIRRSRYPPVSHIGSDRLLFSDESYDFHVNNYDDGILV